ncbi:MAG: hypothetical protein IOMNBAOH_01510 [Rhodocyclaceae bacterium]|nr:hypothetical protein [Rhodocyclaceae bacterium]
MAVQRQPGHALIGLHTCAFGIQFRFQRLAIGEQHFGQPEFAELSATTDELRVA